MQLPQFERLQNGDLGVVVHDPSDPLGLEKTPGLLCSEGVAAPPVMSLLMWPRMTLPQFERLQNGDLGVVAHDPSDLFEFFGESLHTRPCNKQLSDLKVQRVCNKQFERFEGAQGL